MNRQIKLLDVVALNEDLVDRKLYRRRIGTVVEELAPGVFEIEFTDNDGRAFASLGLKATQLMILYPQPVESA